MDMKKSENKWILVSCLQKSIRKGFVVLAQKYAEELFEFEKNYLIYRLSIIAVEDVGLGDVDLVYDFLSTEIKKANIEERGGKDYVMGLVEKLCLANKDRSACDLISLSFLYEDTMLDSANHKETFLNNNEMLVKRVLSAWEMLGAKKMKNPLIKNNDDNINLFLELNSELVEDPKVLKIMELSYKIHNEPHFIAIGLLSYLYTKEKRAKSKIGKYNAGDILVKDFPIELIKDKWLLDGIDWHTREGKAAVYELSKEQIEVNKYLREFLIDSESISTALGMLLFRKVGHQVNKRLIYQNSVAILKTSEQITFKKMLYNDNADFFVADKLMDSAMPIFRDNVIKQFNGTNPKYFPF